MKEKKECKKINIYKLSPCSWNTKVLLVYANLRCNGQPCGIFLM